MGNLLSFVRSLGDKSVSELDDKFRLFIDFEKDKIDNPGEQKVWIFITSLHTNKVEEQCIKSTLNLVYL